MTCLLVEVEQYETQRSMDMKGKKKGNARTTVPKTLLKAKGNVGKFHCQRTVSAPKSPH